jgi:hypothetical protein
MNNPNRAPVTGGVAIALCVPTQGANNFKKRHGQRGPDKAGAKRQKRTCRLCNSYNPGNPQAAMECKGRTSLGVAACGYFNADGSPKI